MKTTLSVRDFALLYNLVSEKMHLMIGKTQWELAKKRKEIIEQQTHKYSPYINADSVSLEDAVAELTNNPAYTQLNHLMTALGELQVEVQTPDVEIKDKP